MSDIELVIKISEEEYNRIQSMDWKNGDRFYDESVRAIHNGITLPKGHGRLIDADNTISKICGNSCGCHLEECGLDKPCFSVRRIKCRKRRPSSRDDGGVSWVFSSCGASVGCFMKYHGALREPLDRKSVV